MQNHKRQPNNFAHHVKFRMVCEIFLCIDFVRFLSPDILCNFLFSPCKQPRYFLLYFFIFFGNVFWRHTSVDPHFSRASPLDQRDSLFICEKLIFGKSMSLKNPTLSSGIRLPIGKVPLKDSTPLSPLKVSTN